MLLNSEIFSYVFGPRKSDRNTMLHQRKEGKEGRVGIFIGVLKLLEVSSFVQFVLRYLIHTPVHNKKTVAMLPLLKVMMCGLKPQEFLFYETV